MKQKCHFCGETEEGWMFNRCPYCGEMAATPAPETEPRTMFICAAWTKRMDGPIEKGGNRRVNVYRCDSPEGHKGDHVDHVLGTNWPQDDVNPDMWKLVIPAMADSSETEPAERPEQTNWENELFKYIWGTNGQLLCNPEKIAEIVEKIRNEGRDSVLYIRCLKHQGVPQYNKDEHGQECTECAVQAACNKYEALRDSQKVLVNALEYAKEVIDDQAERFHKCCRCQLCESAPMVIDYALANAKKVQGL